MPQKIVHLLFLFRLLDVAAQQCDTSVYHVNPQGSCNQCPDPCPPECDPSSSSYLVFTSSNCDGQGVSGGGDGQGVEVVTTTTPAPAPLVNFTVEIVPSNKTCEGDSCSPQDCIRDEISTNCDFGDNPPVDWETELGAMECKVCEQAIENSKCMDIESMLPSDAGIKAAYCNDDFLVIWSTGLPRYDPSAQEYLGSIPLPPGGDPGCRVRTARELLTVYKIPLQVSVQEGANVVSNPLPGIPGLPAAGGVGVSLDGVPIYPNFNNRGQLAWTSCEVDICNAHAGRGEDYHYHGDMFGPQCLYNISEYHDHTRITHPPLVGFGFDGYSIYGRHTEEGLQGEFVNLDRCGGHDHDSYGYHYHAHTEHNLTTDTLDGVPPNGQMFIFDAYYVAPTYCWRGNVDTVSNFWVAGGRQVNYDRSKTSSNAEWNDREELRPCCGSEHFFTSDGLTIPGSTSSTNISTSDGDDEDTTSDGGDDEDTVTLESRASPLQWISLVLFFATFVVTQGF